MDYLGIVALGMGIAALLIVFGRAMWLVHRGDIDEAVRRGSESLYCEHGTHRKIACSACKYKLEQEFAAAEAEKKIVCVPKHEIPKREEAELGKVDYTNVLEEAEKAVGVLRDRVEGRWMTPAESATPTKLDLDVKLGELPAVKVQFRKIDMGLQTKAIGYATAVVFREVLQAQIWPGKHQPPVIVEVTVDVPKTLAERSRIPLEQLRATHFKSAWSMLMSKLAAKMSEMVV